MTARGSESVTLTAAQLDRRLRRARREAWARGARFGYGYGSAPRHVDDGQPPLPSFIADQNPYGKPRAGTTP